MSDSNELIGELKFATKSILSILHYETWRKSSCIVVCLKYKDQILVISNKIFRF